jgi:hypothetical protein
MRKCREERLSALQSHVITASAIISTDALLQLLAETAQPAQMVEGED